ncbi:MAG: DEAD/DEAH box helicase [Clostridia bacterium]|nr:DEAD/DEAH box helicase [Clostridia bacterium]
MKINPLQMEILAGEEEYNAGKEIEETGGVRIAEQDACMIRFSVAGNPLQSVTLSRSMILHCGCARFTENGCCRHAVAVWLSAERNGIPEMMQKKIAPERGKALSDLVLEQMPTEANLHLEVTLALPKRPEDDVRIGLRAGTDKLYVVRDIRALLDAMDMKDPLSFGKSFVYQPEWMRFSEDDERVLNLVRKYLSARDPGDEKGLPAARLIRIPDCYVHELLDTIGDTALRIMDCSGKIRHYRLLRDAKMPMHFSIQLGPRGLSIAGRIPADFQPLTRDCAWGLAQDTLINISREQRGLVRMMWENQYEGKCLFDYSLKETERVIGEILPYLKLRGAVEMSPELSRRLVRLPLKTEVYLDKDGKSVVAEVLFRYGDLTLNPFGSVEEKITLGKSDSLLLRDAETEHLTLEILANAGFRVRKENIRLSGSDAVFDFVSEGVKKLQEIADVFLSRDFKRIMPRRPSLSGSMRMNGDRLELTLERDGEPTDEILEIIEALSRRRRYYRLKNGEFLDLTDLAQWQETAASIYEAAARDGNQVGRDFLSLRAYRAAYLSSMLASSGLEIRMDESISRMAETLNGEHMDEAREPELVPGVALKDYQRRGYEWMCALDRMHMGGVLADDMGLGKTIQVIAMFQTQREPGRTSLVVAPTSLTYNWLSEIRRFAPELSAVVLSGTSAQRSSLIRHVTRHGDVDVLITSYPLIRRDIDMMKDYRFRFVVLDEAQNIKNSGSVAAGAVKMLQADSRFALTGTPMENGVGELWSLFDFILPGYLPGYNTFIRRYQDGENSEDLLRRIRPFLIRRLKQDVLEELPDKMEVTLTAQMTGEQQRIYRAAMERLRPRVDRILQTKGVHQGRMEVLSAITELREICCHPALVMNDYRGGSGKEELLMEILPGLVSGGRRMLLFSQFTSMLKILRKRLEEEGYNTMYLDGDTPPTERQGLTERFNNGEGQIFLISLRAGGSGLNLTGADMVIHYDPWWNPATEDQATDRAHRIGQQKKVQVIRLVTGESIEEQVVELGMRKKALFDRLIRPGESGVNALSEQEIRALFE